MTNELRLGWLLFWLYGGGDERLVFKGSGSYWLLRITLMVFSYQNHTQTMSNDIKLILHTLGWAKVCSLLLGIVYEMAWNKKEIVQRILRGDSPRGLSDV